MRQKLIPGLWIVLILVVFAYATLPVVSNVVLNSTHTTDLTTDNLTLYWTSTDADGNKIVNITDWRINGVSFALLNMPFENTSNAINNATDYSTFNRTGSNTNVTLVCTGGHDNDCYYFFQRKIKSKIDLGKYNQHLNFTNASSFTITAWTNLPRILDGSIFDHYGGSAFTGGYRLNLASNGAVQFIVKNSAGTFSQVATPINSYTTNTWLFTVATFKRGGNMTIYLNGKQRATLNPPIELAPSRINYVIGNFQAFAGFNFNGSIDDVRVYNRTLSLQEILLLNLSRDDIIHSDETIIGETWSSCITPNDGITNGANVCSNNLVILSGNATDTCTYSGSGNWNINFTDNCIINSNTSIKGNLTVFGNYGNLTINATLNFTKSGSYIYINNTRNQLLGNLRILLRGFIGRW